MANVKRGKASVNQGNPQDYVPVRQLRVLQKDRLKAAVARAYNGVELFRGRMMARGMVPEDVRSLEDLRHLPFSQKIDLRDSYPFGLFASPMKDIVRLHASSGTTGKPIVVGYTVNDIGIWTSVMARTFACCGVNSDDIVQNSFGYGLFTGGLGAHYGAEALGAAVVPISGGNTERQLMIMKDFGVTVMCSTPSYFIHLAEKAAEMGAHMDKLPLRIGIFGAEPWSERMRRHIETATGIDAFDIYGLSEIIGPGVASECHEKSGLHVFEDHFYPEIIDPKTEVPLPDGSEGELVLTTLTKEGMPMIRYRTRDITSIEVDKCACGRTLRRIRRISRRSDDMLIVRGVNVFPSQIEAALLSIEGTLPHYQIVLTSEHGLDQIAAEVEVAHEMFHDKNGHMESLRLRLFKAIESIVGIRAEVRLVAPKSIARSEGKAKRVRDLRGQQK